MTQPRNLGGFDTTGLFQRKRNPTLDQHLGNAWHLRVPPKGKREIDRLLLKQLLVGLVDGTAESRCDIATLRLLAIRNGDNLYARAFESIEIERGVPVARFEHRDLHQEPS